MKSSGSIYTFSVFIFATVMLVPPAAQPGSALPANPSGIRYARASPVGSDVQPIPARQNPHIKFASAVAYDSAGAFADSVTIADVNRDGKMDLVVLDYCQKVERGYCATPGTVAVMLGNGDGTFQPPVSYSTGAYWANSVAVGDLNGDGIPDLVLANGCLSLSGPYCSGAGIISVLPGNGDGTFQPAVIYSAGGWDAHSVAIGDLRGNGKLDLVVADVCENLSCQAPSVSVLLGNGDGTFQPAVNYSLSGYEADSVAIGDLNGDGIPDLIVASYCQGGGCEQDTGVVGVLLGNGDGTFQPVVNYSSVGWYTDTVAVGDLRGNGIVDLVVASEFDGRGDSPRDAVEVLLGNGDGTFQPEVTYRHSGPSCGRRVPEDRHKEWLHRDWNRKCAAGQRRWYLPAARHIPLGRL